MDVHRGGFHSARQSRGVHSGASTPVTASPGSGAMRKTRAIDSACLRAIAVSMRPARMTSMNTGAPMGGKSRAEDGETRRPRQDLARAWAQIHLRHVAARLRHAAGAPARRLRHLQGAIRPHALRRSLPRHRTGARAALPRMQSRHRPAQGQSGPVAGGARLSRSRASPVGARRAHAPAPLHETTRQARRGVAANWRSAACYG